MPARQQKSQVQEYVEALVVAGVLTLLLREFVIQPYRIPSPSMCDTLLVGDFLLANKFEYGSRIPFTRIRIPGLRAPRPGDVVVFDYPPDPSQQYIKRCVATAGQTVELRHKELWVDGVKRIEPFVKHVSERDDPAEVSNRDNYRPPTVQPGQLFMMGDNRDDSYDSRFWGPVELDLVKGHAMFIYFSTAGDTWWNGLFNIRFERMFRPIR